MQEFTIIDEKRYALDFSVLNLRDVTNINNDILFHRFEHRVTVGRRGKRYTAFLDNIGNPGKGPTFYIEETTNGHYEWIEDGQLWDDLARWMSMKFYLVPLMPMIKKKI